MAVLADFAAEAVPRFAIVVVADEQARLADWTALGECLAHVAGCRWDQLYLSSLQQQAPVEVALTVHDAQPRAATGDWDGSYRAGLVSPTGTLLLGELPSDVPARWSLPAAGAYRMVVRWRNREPHASSLLGRAAGREGLGGTEHYRIDMWRPAGPRGSAACGNAKSVATRHGARRPAGVSLRP